MKLLVVDDKPSIRLIMTTILRELGFDDIVEAVDGSDAWFKLRAEFQGRTRDVYDLIISDMEMPKMSGLDLLRAVRQDPVLAATPFIMVTTVNTKEVIMATMKLGIKAYIIKPFDKASVTAKLTQAGFLKAP